MVWRVITVYTFAAESLPWQPLKVVLHLYQPFPSRFRWVVGGAVVRLVWLVLVRWRGRSIVRDGIVLVILFFVIFEEIWMSFSDFYDPHVWLDVSEFK
jgi:hypothetical protein